MKTIYRILGKRGRITIPFAFRQHVGFQPDDVLSFTIQEDQTVLIKREKLCNSCTPESEAAESAGVTLLDFLDSLTAANTGAVYVSVVKFDMNAHKVSDWVNIKESGNLASVKNDINAITNGNGTNIHGGLLLGYNRLGMDEVANAGAKYMVLLSDGAESPEAETVIRAYSGHSPKELASCIVGQGEEDDRMAVVLKLQPLAAARCEDAAHT